MTRKTPLYPSHVRRLDRQRKATPGRAPGERYTTASLFVAVQRACDKAGCPRWFPNQLRHLYASTIRKQFGIEATRILLGHSNIRTSEIYAERDSAVAQRVAREVG